MNASTKRLFTLRRFLRANQHIGMTIERNTWGEGWNIHHTSTQWTLWTIYIDQTDGWSLYRAIPDTHRGIDCDDEKLVIRTNDLHLLRCRWEGEWNIFTYGPPQTVIKGTWEGKLAQSFNNDSPRPRPALTKIKQTAA